MKVNAVTVLDLSGKTSGAWCRMSPKKKSEEHTTGNHFDGVSSLQDTTDTSVGNIETKDCAACGVERKLVLLTPPRQGVYKLL